MAMIRLQTAAARAASQGAARATMHDRQTRYVVTGIDEVPDENTLATTAPTTIQLVSEAEDRIANLTERFLVQAQALASEHVMLNYQQEGPRQAQQAALVAVHSYAESGLKELANR
ncbi:hypothetical protein ON010_g16583 [Phytophthora cinnamomi]|nr:hypothetical protein ON010_g16583 [Phytophthora cinnamomi]